MAGFANRGPDAAASLHKVKAQLAEGWPAGLAVLCGDDAYHSDAALRAILDALLPREEREYALTIYGEEKVEVGTVVAACRSRGMFAERRVVLVRELAALDGDAEALIEYAKAPPPQSHLIIRALKLDRRKKLHKSLIKHGIFLPFEKSQDAIASCGEIKRIAADHGLVLDRDANILLAQICEGDLYRAVSELAKLSAWLGKKGSVTVQHIRETVAGDGAMSGWAMSDAILIRDRSGALAAARRLVDSGEEPIRMLGGLAYRARTMLAAKAMLERGRPAGQVVKAVRAWNFESALMRGMARYELDELLAFPAHLLAADLALKSRQIAPSAVLESLVDRLVGT